MGAAQIRSACVGAPHGFILLIYGFLGNLISNIISLQECFSFQDVLKCGPLHRYRFGSPKFQVSDINLMDSKLMNIRNPFWDSVNSHSGSQKSKKTGGTWFGKKDPVPPNFGPWETD